MQHWPLTIDLQRVSIQQRQNLQKWGKSAAQGTLPTTTLRVLRQSIRVPEEQIAAQVQANLKYTKNNKRLSK